MTSGQHLPAIALNGYGMALDGRQSHEAGFLEHVTKPANLELLLAALHRVASALSTHT